jgi:hypothetical protein
MIDGEKESEMVSALEATSGVCKLCREPRKLCDSHIIPEFMYKPLYDKHRMIFVSQENGHSKREKPLQLGLREKLLCSECEGDINTSYEQPNIGLWRGLAEERPVRGISVTPLRGDDRSRGAQIEGLNYPSFKLLLLSMLWRASVAKRSDYAEVTLGRHEERIRQMLREKNPGSQDDYPCLVYVFTEPNFGLMGRPARTRLDGFISYQFLLPSMLLWFVVADSGRPYSLAKFAAKEDGSLIALFIRPDQVPFVKQAARGIQKLMR